MIISMFVAAALGMGCSEVNPNYTPDTGSGENDGWTSEGFALGADISSVTEYEHDGITFYNKDGNARECTALMKETGMNSIRLRVWVDPENGWCNKSDVLVKALRAQRLGMRIMIDFHYSDTWADPGRQLIPAAWLDYTTEELADAVANHTKEVLTMLKDNGVDVEWVQVGNEVTTGMLYHTAVDAGNNANAATDNGGSLYNNSTFGITAHPENFTAFINAGYDAVKEVYPEAQVIVHVDRGNSLNPVNTVFRDALGKHNGKYDIIGLSLYPYDAEADDWQATINKNVDDCIANISAVYNTFQHEVMIVETGMPYDMPDETYDMLTRLIAGAKGTGHCLGVFYWEPETPESEGYKMGAFENNMPTHALDAFTEAAAE